jgi:glutathione synthase/RimK-type ligase-like ATP-grasp enzyme
MKIAIYYHQKIRKDNYAHKWIEILKSLSIEYITFIMSDDNLMQKLALCDGVMWHFIHNPDEKKMAQTLLNAIEENLKIPVFPNYATRWHFDEKISQYYLFESLNIPTIKTDIFWDFNSAVSFINSVSFPLIYKLSTGAGAANVVKLDNKNEAKKRAKLLFKNGIFPYGENEYKESFFSTKYIEGFLKRFFRSIRYIATGVYPKMPKHYEVQRKYLYLQEFLDDNSFDIRITIIGKRAFGFIRYNREGDFRASGSGNVDYTKEKIPEDALKMAFDVSNRCGFQSMAYDFLFDNQSRVVLNEISYSYVNEAICKCDGHWDDTLIWREGKMWPEEAQLEDFMKQLEVK